MDGGQGRRKLNRGRGPDHLSYQVGSSRMEVKEQQEELEPVLLTPASPPGERPGQGHARRSWMVAVAAFVIVAAVVISGIVPRVKARATLRAETNRLAVPTVIVV